jgi:hypothetical protein
MKKFILKVPDELHSAIKHLSIDMTINHLKQTMNDIIILSIRRYLDEKKEENLDERHISSDKERARTKMLERK